MEEMPLRVRLIAILHQIAKKEIYFSLTYAYFHPHFISLLLSFHHTPFSAVFRPSIHVDKCKISVMDLHVGFCSLVSGLPH